MIALLQRVTEAAVEVNGKTIARIGPGLLVLAAIERRDGDAQAARLAERVLSYRIFSDSEGKMNLDVRQVAGEVLLVPQFTLAADTARGNRPSFTPAASPEQGKALFDSFLKQVKNQYASVKSGAFGAAMKVSLVNDGPVTIWLQTSQS